MWEIWVPCNETMLYWGDVSHTAELVVVGQEWSWWDGEQLILFPFPDFLVETLVSCWLRPARSGSSTGHIYFSCGILYEIFHHHFWNPHSRWVLVTNQMMISQCKMVYLPPDYPSVCVLLNHHKIVAMQSQFLQQEIHLQVFSDKSFDPGTCLGLYLRL